MVTHPGKKQADKIDFFRQMLSNLGPDDSTTMVHDYANKEWSGMMRHFYFPRWKMFVDYCMGKLKGEDPAAPDYFKFEQNWAAKPDRYAPLQLPAAARTYLVSRILSE
ncbi:MAG TPA: alpha-N-acetylglucosaminidase C-terminal domain-containing protein [Chitinophagaceae bacterium]